jgi:hypothetical protein
MSSGRGFTVSQNLNTDGVDDLGSVFKENDLAVR